MLSSPIAESVTQSTPALRELFVSLVENLACDILSTLKYLTTDHDLVTRPVIFHRLCRARRLPQNNINRIMLILSQSLAIERLHSCDDAFRNQLEKQKEVYEREIDRLTSEKEELINQSNTKVKTLKWREGRREREGAGGRKLGEGAGKRKKLWEGAGKREKLGEGAGEGRS